MGFKSRKVIITGASRGIGAAVAKEIAAQGGELFLLSRDEAALERLRSEITIVASNASSILIESVDVSDPAQVERAFRSMRSAWSVADVLINNAGAIRVEPIEDVADEDWERQINVNLSGAFYCSRAFVRWCKALRHEASILNISSLAGVQGSQKFPGFVAYAAAKAGVVGMTEALAEELRADKIKVNTLAPGAVDTQMLREALPHFKTSTTPLDVARKILQRLEEVDNHGTTGEIWSLENA